MYNASKKLSFCCAIDLMYFMVRDVYLPAAETWVWEEDGIPRGFISVMRSVVTGSKHADKNADVCTDPTCCQAWISDAEMHKNWGDDYAANLDKITAAVTDTDGEYLVSGGAPILAAFHSSSGGTTESSADVWGTDLPYLVSVSSPETEAEVPNFKTTM